jgi:hypothetical protein
MLKESRCHKSFMMLNDRTLIDKQMPKLSLSSVHRFAVKTRPKEISKVETRELSKTKRTRI